MTLNEAEKRTQKMTNRMASAKEKLQKAKEVERKLATRLKIELGGLIIKAGLAEEDRSVILGALLHVKKGLQENEKWRDGYRRMGAGAFAAKRPPVPAVTTQNETSD